MTRAAYIAFICIGGTYAELLILAIVKSPRGSDE